MTKEEIKIDLLNHIQPGSTIYGLVRHVSPSGLTRHISLFIIADNRLIDITHSASILLEYNLSKKNYGMVVSGTGMDMVYHCIYGLGSILFGRNQEAKTWNYHTNRNGEKGPETDGGYFLKESII